MHLFMYIFLLCLHVHIHVLTLYVPVYYFGEPLQRHDVFLF